jgi:hypothetical protein
MKNTLIVDRARYEQIYPMLGENKNDILKRRGVNYSMKMLLDFYIIVEAFAVVKY